MSRTATLNDTPSKSSRTRWQPRFGALAGIWGASFLFVKIGDEQLPPLDVALGRMAFGAAAVLVLLLMQRQRLPRGWATWGHLAVAAFLMNAAPFTLFAYGEQRVSSVVAGLLNAATPLMNLPFALLLLPNQRLRVGQVVGIGTGFVGILTVFAIWQGFGSNDLVGSLLCALAPVCYGLGGPYINRFLSSTNEGVTSLAAGQMLCGTAELLIAFPLLGSIPHALSVPVIISIAALGILGTGIAYVLQHAIIRAAGATVASTVTYLVPVVSTVLGVVVLQERLTWNQPLGAVLILLGAALVQRRFARRSPAPARPPSGVK